MYLHMTMVRRACVRVALWCPPMTPGAAPECRWRWRVALVDFSAAPLASLTGSFAYDTWLISGGGQPPRLPLRIVLSEELLQVHSGLGELSILHGELRGEGSRLWKAGRPTEACHGVSRCGQWWSACHCGGRQGRCLSASRRRLPGILLHPWVLSIFSEILGKHARPCQRDSGRSHCLELRAGGRWSWTRCCDTRWRWSGRWRWCRGWPSGLPCRGRGRRSGCQRLLRDAIGS